MQEIKGEWDLVKGERIKQQEDTYEQKIISCTREKWGQIVTFWCHQNYSV